MVGTAEAPRPRRPPQRGSGVQFGGSFQFGVSFSSGLVLARRPVGVPGVPPRWPASPPGIREPPVGFVPRHWDFSSEDVCDTCIRHMASITLAPPRTIAERYLRGDLLNRSCVAYEALLQDVKGLHGHDVKEVRRERRIMKQLPGGEDALKQLDARAPPPPPPPVPTSTSS